MLLASSTKSAISVSAQTSIDDDRCGDAPLAVAGYVLETQNFSDLMHRQSLGWHGASRVLFPVSVPLVDDCPRTAPPPLEGGWLRSESVAGLRRNQWLEWIGITGCFTPDSASKPPFDAGQHQVSRDFAADPAGRGVPGDDLPVAGIDGEGDADPLAVPATDLEYVG